MKRHSALFLLAAVLILSCAHPGDLPQSGPARFEVDIPTGWQKHYTRKYFLIYKGDPFTQYILIQERPIDRPFKNCAKKIDAGMLPQEAADVVIDELASDKQINNLKVIENSPATIKGNEGFKIVFTYGLSDGSTFKTLYYGFIRDGAYYSLRYNVTRIKNFETDLPVFDAVLDSLRFVAVGSV